MHLYVYRFTLRCQGPVRFTGFPGIVLRGALGDALYDLLCVHRHRRSCRGCPAANVCAYPRLFRPFADLVGLDVKRFRDLPPPFTVRPRFAFGSYAAPETLDFELTLVGRANRDLAAVLRAFLSLETHGIGGGRRRGPVNGAFRLDRVVALGPNGTSTVLSTERDVVTPVDLPWRFPEDFGGVNRSRTVSRESFTLRLRSPTLLDRERSRARDLPDFARLATALVRRTSLLSEAYGGRKLYGRSEHMALKRAAAEVESVDPQLRWTESNRWSSRSCRGMTFGGWEGAITCRGDPAPWLPLLRAARFLHVGRHAAFGWGEVVMVERG